MAEIKQAWWLAKFEVKEIAKRLWLILPFALVFGFFFTVAIEEEISFLYDIFFIICFWCMTYWMRPKEIQFQKVDEGVYASPYFLMLNQLAVKREALIVSRFLIYFIFAIPFNIIVLTIMLVFSDFYRTELQGVSSAAFFVIWLSFGIIGGALFPASDVGDTTTKNKWFYAIYTILFFGILLGAILGVHFWAGKGVVLLSIEAAQKWPAIAIISSVILSVISIVYGKKYAEKQIRRMNYLK
ncbi:hypothetical protein [Bacillus mesophilum]|uniref:ABC-2 transporter permease n=1 Tax=Bacillus mesophilum TaxID=1071718 RepID=A0A7V7UTZ2_9BACI|nr:hypothetical protein [Bacillus mesophilum]KAB2330575.1 hypothetical protein F7732_18165 [Bacillus mesophilum]